MDTKEALTNKVISKLPDSFTDLTFKKYHSAIWVNIRTNGERSFALTQYGFKTLTELLELKFYCIDLPSTLVITNKLLLWLDKFIDCPFFLDGRKIYVSKEQIAVQLILFSGDLNKFGTARQRSFDKNTT